MFSWNRTQLRKAQNSDFHAGETWEYQTRPQEPASTFRVLRVETLPDGSNVVHIEVRGLQIVSPNAPGGRVEVAGHLPVSETALSQSATRRVSTGESSPMPEGYENWRREWEQGRAGVFTIALSEIVDVLEGATQSAPQNEK